MMLLLFFFSVGVLFIYLPIFKTIPHTVETLYNGHLGTEVAVVKRLPSLRGFKQETEHTCNVLRWLNAPSCTGTNRVLTVRWLCGTVVSSKAKLL